MKGISYYPMDVNFLDDTKFGFIDAEYGAEGVVIILRLWQVIYTDEGYYCRWSDDEATLFARRYGYGKKGHEVQAIVQEALKRGIFHKEMYERHGILTSRRIQETYVEAVKRRVSCEIKPEYSLLSATGGEKKCVQNTEKCMKKQEKCLQNADKKTESADIFGQNKINKNKINTPPLLGESGSGEGERGENLELKDKGEELRVSLKAMIEQSEYEECEKSEALRLSNDGDERTIAGGALMRFFLGKEKKYTFEQYIRSLQRREQDGVEGFRPRWTFDEWDSLQWIKKHVPVSQGNAIRERLDIDPGLIDVVTGAIDAILKAQKTRNPVLLPGEFILARLTLSGRTAER